MLFKIDNNTFEYYEKDRDAINDIINYGFSHVELNEEDSIKQYNSRIYYYIDALMSFKKIFLTAEGQIMFTNLNSYFIKTDYFMESMVRG